MKIKNSLLVVLLAMSVVTTRADQDDTDDFLNHLTFSGRFGFNIGVHYSQRTTAGGSAFNFLDGYVLPDSKAQPGSEFAVDPTGTYPGGITHNWGYDNSSRQDDTVNKEILFTAINGSGNPLGHSDDPDVVPGFEIGYQHDFGTNGDWHFGLEGAVNYQNICLQSHEFYNGPADQFGFPYTFNGVSSNTPPAVYQGTFGFNLGGPNFDISGFPNVTNNVPINLAGHGSFEANIWGWRLGPTIDRKFGDRWRITLSGGLALGLVDGDASWTETLTVNGVTDPTRSATSHKDDLLAGYYLGANVSWQLSKRWDLNAGLQYQDLGTYHQQVGDRTVAMDLSQSIYVTVGMSYNF